MFGNVCFNECMLQAHPSVKLNFNIQVITVLSVWHLSYGQHYGAKIIKKY